MAQTLKEGVYFLTVFPTLSFLLFLLGCIHLVGVHVWGCTLGWSVPEMLHFVVSYSKACFIRVSYSKATDMGLGKVGSHSWPHPCKAITAPQHPWTFWKGRGVCGGVGDGYLLRNITFVVTGQPWCLFPWWKRDAGKKLTSSGRNYIPMVSLL